MTFVAVFAASLIVPDALDFGCVSFHNPHKTTPYVPGFSGLSRLPSLPPPLQGGSKQTRPSMFPVLLTYLGTCTYLLLVLDSCLYETTTSDR